MPDPGWTSMNPKEQIRSQLARLRTFLEKQVIPYHPYYRELFSREGIDPRGIQRLEIPTLFRRRKLSINE